jgi:hypothetical protein
MSSMNPRIEKWNGCRIRVMEIGHTRFAFCRFCRRSRVKMEEAALHTANFEAR